MIAAPPVVPAPTPRRARVRVGAGAAVVLLLIGLAIAVFAWGLSPKGSTVMVTPSARALPRSGAAAAIYVHVLGEVVKPGLYELRDGDRVLDAIAAAAGFTPTADQAAVNLARFVNDGEQIVVPAIGAAAASDAAVSGGVGGGTGKININTADASALETLPRVGPAMAQRILDWRKTNGSFTSIDDLGNVPGIGDKTLESLRELVTL